MNKILRYSFVALMAMLFGNIYAEETVDFTAQGYANGSEVASYQGTNFTLTFAGNGASNAPKYYNSGTSIRMYAKNSMTITSTKTIKAIKFTLDGSRLINENNCGFDVGEYDYATTKWTGSATTIVLTNKAASQNQIGLQKMTIYFDGDDIPGDTHIANTEETAYTVAEAIAIIDKGEALSETVFVKGKVSQVDSYNDTYKSITYWISDDGTTTTQLECYSGKGLNGADFSSVDDLALGASVIVKGTLTKYGSIYEFNSSNQLVKYDNSTNINTIKTDADVNAPVYNLAGQKVDNSYKGVVIMNGKKMIQK